MTPSSEAFSRVLIDKALEASGWDLLNPKEVSFEVTAFGGRADYLLRDSLGRVLCVLEAKRDTLDPYDAKEQARGYAENLRAPFVILSNGVEHWFWNYERSDQQDAYRIERLPSLEDLLRLRLKNLQPPRPLLTDAVKSDYLVDHRPDLSLRGYQINALDEIARQFDTRGKRGFLLEMATGTGKTVLCAALIRRFLVTRNAERVLFIVDRIDLARQTLEEFSALLSEYKPVIYKTARRTGDLLGASVVIATIQSLMTDSRYRQEFSPFYFDLVVNDEAHRSIYGDAREAVQFFQATRIGLTATPKAYLKNVNVERLAAEDPRSLEARQLRDTYHYFGCEPGEPTFRYDIIDAVNDPDGPFLCLPKIIDCRSDITTQALQASGWVVTINEQEDSYKIQDLERKIFTPHRNRVMCEAFLREAQHEPGGLLGRSIVFAVNQNHATAITQILNNIRPGIALTITSRIEDAATLSKEFRSGRRLERIAVSVDMLSTGFNYRELLNIVLMRPVFSPTEYIQIKGRGTRRFTFVDGNSEYEKTYFFLLDFCAVAEYFEEHYDYTVPLEVPARRNDHGVAVGSSTSEGTEGHADLHAGKASSVIGKEIPIWEGSDRIVSRELRVVGPNGERVDVMTFRGSFERDIRSFTADNDDFHEAVNVEDDDSIETILQERFYHRPEMYYAPDKLVASYGIPATSAAFVYSALGKKSLPSKEQIVSDTVESVAARFNLRYNEQKWLKATAELVSTDPEALSDFILARYNRLFERSQFRTLGGLHALSGFGKRDDVFEALRQSQLVQCSRYTLLDAIE
jgi:type I restriction enzyme R subunit